MYKLWNASENAQRWKGSDRFNAGGANGQFRERGQKRDHKKPKGYIASHKGATERKRERERERERRDKTEPQKKT